MPKLRLGTRGSKLALTQAHSVQQALLEQNVDLLVDIVTIKTSGDKGERTALGAFTREIQYALQRDEIDVALHCLKDLPTEAVPGLQLSAYLEREDARDALISRVGSLEALPPGAIVGTGSVRRTSQLSSIRSDLQYRPLMGNVDTRLRKLLSGEYDAIVLAVAGLRRLGLHETWDDSDFAELQVVALDMDVMTPAPGQAVLVLETRKDDVFAIDSVVTLHHPVVEQCACAERTFLKAFGGGCSVPVAAYAEPHGSHLKFSGLVAAPNGETVLRGTGRGNLDSGKSLASKVASELISRGALSLFQAGGVGR